MDKFTIPNSGRETEKVKRYTIMFDSHSGIQYRN